MKSVVYLIWIDLESTISKKWALIVKISGFKCRIQCLLDLFFQILNLFVADFYNLWRRVITKSTTQLLYGRYDKIHIKHCIQYLYDDPINVRTIMISIYIIIITFQSIIFQCWRASSQVFFFLTLQGKIWLRIITWQNKCSASLAITHHKFERNSLQRMCIIS